MSDGAAAIIGVIVGGFITLGTSYGLVRRREKRDARGARLIIRSEFDEAATAISYAFESNSAPRMDAEDVVAHLVDVPTGPSAGYAG
jgi:hypothetical protein